jgi:uncharacterized protein YcbK (DUF882 family)
MPDPKSPIPVFDRRSFLRQSVSSVAALTLFSRFAGAEPLMEASPELSALPERSLSFHNLHTNEHLRAVYWKTGEYLASSLAEINRVLRDHRTDEEHEIDSGLLDLLCGLRLRLDTTQPLQIISGYRSPATNAMLKAQSEGVATRSLHMEGRAVDIRIPGRNLSLVRKAALAMKAGGVGYYSDSNFVHVDVGRVRSW